MQSTRRKMLRTVGAASTASIIALSGCTENEGGGGGGGGGGGAGDYPSDDIEVIIGSAEGGGLDSFTRAFADPIQSDLGVSFEMRNVAPTIRGATEVFQSDSDGYTIGTGAPPSEQLSMLENDPGITLSEIGSIATMGSLSFTVMTHQDFEVEDFEDLKSRYDSGDMETLAVPNGASPDVILAPWLKQDPYNLNYDRTVGYAGGGEIIQAVLTKEVDAGIQASLSQPSVREEGGDPIVQLGDEPAPAIPDVPTISSLGYPKIPGNGAATWLAYWGPPGMSEEKRQIVADAVEVGVNEKSDFADEQGFKIDVRKMDEMDKVRSDLESLVEEAKSL